MLKLEQLYYLTKVAKYKSINKAAEELYITKAAVSTAIKQLEKTCGFPLLERTYHGVRLTAEGERVKQLADQILELCDEIESIYFETEKEAIIEKKSLYVTSVTMILLTQKIISKTAKTSDFFNIIEMGNDLEEICRKVKLEGGIALLQLQETQRRRIEAVKGISVKTLCTSKQHLVSSKTTKHVSKDKKAISFEEYIKLPKVAITNYNPADQNVVIRTEVLSTYIQAILADWGIGMLAKYPDNINCVDASQFRWYEPVDYLDKLEVVIIYSPKNGEEHAEILERIVKSL